MHLSNRDELLWNDQSFQLLPAASQQAIPEKREEASVDWRTHELENLPQVAISTDRSCHSGVALLTSGSQHSTWHIHQSEITND